MPKSGYRPDNFQRLLAICGILGPIWYAILVIILGLLRPGYDHVAQLMSELGEAGAPNAVIMNIAGFALLGVMMIAFAVALHRGIGEGKGSKIGPALVALSGAALVLSAIFPCDPGCVDESPAGVAHSVFAMISAFAMIFAPLILCPRLWRDSLWQGYRYFSLATVIVAGVVSAVYGFSVFEQWTGALQRVSMGVPLLWMEGMSIRLLRLSSRPDEAIVGKLEL